MKDRDPCFTIAQLRKITRYSDTTLRKLLKDIPKRKSYDDSTGDCTDCWDAGRVYEEIILSQVKSDSMDKFLRPKKTRGERADLTRKRSKKDV